MDFPGEPFTFSQHSGVVLGSGKLGACPAQLVGNCALVFGFQEQCPVSQPCNHRKDGPEHRSQDHRKLQAAVGRSPAVEPQRAHQKGSTHSNRG
ncbi:hypothetical protein D3C73_987650 [compost metagenome]